MCWNLRLVFYAIQIYLYWICPSGLCNEDILSSDVCSTNGRDIQCEQYTTVAIRNIECGSGGHACAPFVNRTIYDVCNGQRFCGDLDMRNMVSVYCDNQVVSARRVELLYRCVKDTVTTSTCRVNVCPKTSPGLKCSNGDVIHFQYIICKDGRSKCSWETYVTLYTLCEARSECSSNALQSLLPSYCQHDEPSLRNVLVDYVCLKDPAVENVCSGTVRKLKQSFGIVLSPGFIDNSAPVSSHCYWSIEPLLETTVKVMVHLAYHKDSMPLCVQTFLQIQFTDCNTGRIEKGSFCDIRKNNQEILSCGAVYINSVLKTVKPEFADKFLISYQVSNSSTGKPFGATSVEPCGIWIPPLSSSAPAPAAPTKNYHPTKTIFDNTHDTLEKPQETDSSPDAYSILRKLKMMFLYIFFGLIIAALIISLVMVIISYRKVDKKARYRVDRSEKVVLWNKDDPPARNGDTPLETFRHNSVADTAISDQNNIADISLNHYDVLVPTQSPDGTVIATIHLNSENDKRLSAGSGFSSFRPNNRNSGNPYASYSSLNSNNSPQYYGRVGVANNGSVHNTMNGQKITASSPVRNGDRQPLCREAHPPINADDVEHYTVNEDDYAIVKKSRIPNNRSDNYDLLDELEPTYDNLFDRDIGRFRPTSGPYDKNRKSNSEMNFHFNPPYHHDDDL